MGKLNLIGSNMNGKHPCEMGAATCLSVGQMCLSSHHLKHVTRSQVISYLKWKYQPAIQGQVIQQQYVCKI